MNLKQRAAFLSVLSNTGVLLLKMAVGLFINSISVLIEAIHSAMDLVSSLIAFFAIGKSSQPADPAHPYGHGKLESLSGLIEAGLITVAGGFLSSGSRSIGFLIPRGFEWFPWGWRRWEYRPSSIFWFAVTTSEWREPLDRLSWKPMRPI